MLVQLSVAELTIKSSLGKIDINFDIIKMIRECGFEMLDFNAYDALKLSNMPFFHRDPFDRMLISQALSNDYHIMSSDGKFKLYDCKLI